MAACFPQDKLDLPHAEPGARLGGSLVVGVSQPDSLDPQLAATSSAQMILQTACDSLIQIDPLSGQLKPAVARAWDVSDGGKTISVNLRPNVKFQDGEEVTAQDVAFSLSRVADPALASGLSTVLQPVVGYDEVHEPTPRELARRVPGVAPILSGIGVKGKYEFEIKLKEPRADFVRALAEPLAIPVPKKRVQKEGSDRFAQGPVCAGPYRISVKPGDQAIVLSRARTYYRKNTGYTKGGQGYFDRVEFKILENREAEAAAFISGALDVAHVPGGSSFNVPPGARVVEAPTASLEYLGMPNRYPPFDQKEVRVALSQAIDRGQAAGDGRSPATGFVPPPLKPAYRADSCAQEAPAHADPAAARASLAKSGVNLTGQTIPLYFNDEFGHRSFVERVAQNWKDTFGLETKLVPMTWAQYLAKASSARGFDGPFRMSWAPEYQSVDPFLAPVFSEAGIGRTNFSFFSDQNFERRLRKARQATLEPRRSQAYGRVEDLVCEDFPIIPVVFGHARYLVSSPALASARRDYAGIANSQILIRELYRP